MKSNLDILNDIKNYAFSSPCVREPLKFPKSEFLRVTRIWNKFIGTYSIYKEHGAPFQKLTLFNHTSSFIFATQYQVLLAIKEYLKLTFQEHLLSEDLTIGYRLKTAINQAAATRGWLMILRTKVDEQFLDFDNEDGAYSGYPLSVFLYISELTQTTPEYLLFGVKGSIK